MANMVPVKTVRGSHLKRSIWLLVGKQQERVGLRHILTPHWVVMTTVRFAQSGEIIHRVAMVWGSIGTILHKQMCPLRLDSLKLESVLKIWTIEDKTR